MTRLKALVSATVIGVVLIEAATAALQALTPTTDVLQAHAAEPFITAGAGLALICIWFAGGTVAGAMAAALTDRCLQGWIAGVLLAVPAGLLMLVPGWPPAMAVLAFVPLAGALTGTAMTRRLIRADRDDRAEAHSAGL